MNSIVEWFGYSPEDRSAKAQLARETHQCPSIGRRCEKLRDGDLNGVCTIRSARAGPVICCPDRFYANDYQVLMDAAHIAFGAAVPLMMGGERRSDAGEHVVVFGARHGSELRVPVEAQKPAPRLDWVLAHINASGRLVDFVGLEVHSVGTKGNPRPEPAAQPTGQARTVNSDVRPKWEHVNVILSQIIYTGHVLEQEPLCLKGLFVVCQAPLYERFLQRLGGGLPSYPLQRGTVTFLQYDLGPPPLTGTSRDLRMLERSTTTVEDLTLAFSAPRHTPPPRSFERAIRAQL